MDAFKDLPTSNINGDGLANTSDFHLGKNGLLHSLVCLLIINTIACSSIVIVSGTSPIVGVNPKDVNLYSYDTTLFSNETDPILSTQPYYQWFSSIHSCLLLVENVSDNNITVQFTYLYRNGTTDTTTKWVDVGTGYASDSEAARGYFTALNATIFNVTSPRTYLGVSRETGHLYGGFQNGTLVWSYNGTERRLLYNYTLDYYADKVTGTLLEYTETISNRNETYYSEASCHVVITQSNIVTEFPPNLVSLLFIVAAPLLGLAIAKESVFPARTRRKSAHN